MNIHPIIEIFQSQVVVVIMAKNPRFAGHASGLVRPMARCSGSQNTEKPQAMPMHR